MTPDPTDALDIPAALWRRRWLILLLAVVTAVGALTASMLQVKTYTSSAKVWVKPTAINPPGSVPLASTIDLATEAELVRSLPVAERAAEILGTDGNAQALLGSISVDVPPEGQVLTISSSSTSGSAQQTTQAFADAYLDFKTDQATEQVAEAIATAQEQLTGLEEEVAKLSTQLAEAEPGSPAAISLQNDLTQANGQIAIWRNTSSILNVSAVDAGSVIVPANLPTSPSSPNPAEDAARGFIVGLVIGALAALATESAKRARQRSSTA